MKTIERPEFVRRHRPIKANRKSRTALPFISFIFLTFICVWPDYLAATESRPAEQLVFPKPVSWQKCFKGIDFAELKIARPRPMQGHMVRIDLTEPNLQFVVTPDNGTRPGETDSLRTSSFLKKMQCKVAINANPFSPVHNEEGKPLEVRGLLVNDGEVISTAEDDLPALLISSDNKASIAQPPFNLSTVRHAVGGFSIVLKQGKIKATRSPKHPRTAAGISGDGRYLYLLVIDGRQSGYSEGATTAEVAAWLKKIGATEGINLDGGGTSTLVMVKPDGTALVINRPIHLGKPGLERPSGGHLGIHADPQPHSSTSQTTE